MGKALTEVSYQLYKTESDRQFDLLMYQSNPSVALDTAFQRQQRHGSLGIAAFSFGTTVNSHTGAVLCVETILKSKSNGLGNYIIDDIPYKTTYVSADSLCLGKSLHRIKHEYDKRDNPN